MAEWSRYLPDLLPHVGGCADPVAEQELKRAAAEFFRRTRGWRRWLSPLTLQASVRTYDLVLPAGAMVVRLEKATLDGSPIEIRSYQSFAADPGGADEQGAGVASSDRVSVTLAQFYPAGAELQVEVSLTCSDSSTGLDDELFEQHRDAIVAGAKGRLMLMPEKPFTNLELGSVARSTFEVAIGSEGIDAYRGHTNNTPRQRPKWC
jgi:hypothetical protein